MLMKSVVVEGTEGVKDSAEELFVPKVLVINIIEDY